MAIENGSVQHKRYKLVAPDGGWGYMICLALILNVPMTMFVSSFGIIFNDFIKQLRMTSTSITLLGGISIMGMSLSGFFTASLLTLMSQRKLAFFATFLFNLGGFMMIYINTELMFYVSQIIQNVGMGVFFNISFTALNEYFVEKRLLAISITQFAAAVGGSVAPYFVEWSLTNYGYRGALFLISGISLHTFVSAALLQPVKWHMVKVEVEIPPEELKLLNEKSSLDTSGTTPVITVTGAEPNFDNKIEIIEKVDEDENKTNKNSKSLFHTLVDTTTLKQYMISNACVGPSFCTFAELWLIIILPQALYSLGWHKDLVAKAVSLSSLGDMIARIAFAVFSKWFTKFGSQEVFLISTAVAFISRLGMLCSENEIVILIFITLMGAARTSSMILPAMILAEIFGDKFTSAMGIHMMLVGILNMTLGPAVGAIRDVTDSYSTAIYVLSSCYAVCTLLGSIELLYKKNKHKRMQQLEAAAVLKNLKGKNKRQI